MKLYSKLAILALAGCFMAACTEDDTYQPGAWDAEDGYQNVSFAQTSFTAELDPTDPTEAVIEVRRDTNMTEAVKVEYNIIQNTDSVFTVGECHFAEGESVAYIHVEFPNAKIGKPYTLQLQITDPRFVSSYTTNNTAELTVTRIKWNSLGKGVLTDNYIWGGQNTVAEVFQRDDDHSKFRIYHPFHDIMVQASDGNRYPATMFSNFDAEKIDEYLTFQIIPTTEESGEEFLGQKIQQSGLVYYADTYTGYAYDGDVFCMLHPSRFNSKADPSNWTQNVVLSWLDEENMIPGKVLFAPIYYLFNSGGAYSDGTEKDNLMFEFPGYKEPVKVDVSQDVQYEEVFTGAFASEQLGATGTATLLKGTEITLTDNKADSIFLADFGQPYAIVGGYTDETILYFCVDAEGNVRAPEFATADGGTTKLQSLGFQAAGANVYAKINEGQSSFSKTVISLNITFTNEDESIVYGTANEVLSNITYNTVGTADYGFSVLWAQENEDGTYSTLWQNGLELQERDDQPGTYRLQNWGPGINFEFSIDFETNAVSIPVQYVMTDATYGDIYIGAASELYQGYEEYPCTYDPETKTVMLVPAYFLTDGRGFEPSYEYIVMHIGEMPAEPAAAPKKAAAKRTTNVKPSVNCLYNPWGNAKKVNKMERFGKPVWMEFAK